MFNRILARDRYVFFGLVLLGVVTVTGGYHVANWVSKRILMVDAEQIAQSWAELVIDRFRNPVNPSSSADRGTQVEMVSNQLLAAFHANVGTGHHAEDDTGHVSATNDYGMFHRGRFISQIFRYAIYGRDGTVFAKSGRFEDVHDLIFKEGSVNNRAFETALSSGDRSSVSLPQHIRRVFVPYRTARTTPYVVAVDLDQSAATTLVNNALGLVVVFTGLLTMLGIGVPAVLIWRRTSEILEVEDKLRHLALHDDLTGLPNRVQLREHLARAVARARRLERPMAAMCLDLDRFKDVNDTLGHATGDALLEEVAIRLAENVRDGDLVGRLGGDEFAIIAENLNLPDDAINLATRLRDAISKPYRVNGHEIVSSTSIGISVGPLDGTEAEALLKNADLALYRAKYEGRNRFRFFEQEMDEALTKRREIEKELRAAIRLDQLELHYQPQFDVVTEAINGYEALLRWTHPTLGAVPPGTFIPIAEECGMIATLGEWVLRNATEYATTWPKDTRLAVNLSPAQFKNQDIVDLVRNVLDDSGLEPHRLELEITEGLLLQNTDEVIATLKELDKLGVSIAMDDFGTGYSSLSYLTRFPVKKIKIDRSFVAALNSDVETSAIVNTIVGLGQSLNVTITAEGVETEDQLRFLKDTGCDLVQGYLCGRPAPNILENASGAQDDDETTVPVAATA